MSQAFATRTNGYVLLEQEHCKSNRCGGQRRRSTKECLLGTPLTAAQ